MNLGGTFAVKSLRAACPWDTDDGFVREYRVEYSLDGTTWQHLRERDNSAYVLTEPATFLSPESKQIRP